jgi:hypothetical protein
VAHCSNRQAPPHQKTVGKDADILNISLAPPHPPYYPHPSTHLQSLQVIQPGITLLLLLTSHHLLTLITKQVIIIVIVIEVNTKLL